MELKQLNDSAEQSGCAPEATKTTLKTANISINTKSAARMPASKNSYNNTNKRDVWQNVTDNINTSQHINSILKQNRYQTKLNCISTTRPLAIYLIIMTIAVIQFKPATAIPMAETDNNDLATGTSLQALENADLTHQQQLRQLSTHSDTKLRTRKRKRHSNYLYFHNNMHESATQLEWENPCGGVYEPTEQHASGMTPVKQYLKTLRQTTRNEFRTLQQELPNAIDVSKIEMWNLHRYQYKFLPKLKRDSRIALKRMYSNMQTFVASFAYLGRIQYKWEHSKMLQASKLTHELNELFLSAHRMLCEIETTINGSYPNSNKQKLTTISRADMNRRLKFSTRRIESTHGLTEADPIDLLFVKHAYYDYLSKMWTILRRQTKRPGQVLLHWGSLENGSALNLSSSDENMNLSLNSIMQESDGSSSVSESIETLLATAAKQEQHQQQQHRNAQHFKRKQRRTQQQSAEFPESLF